MNEYSVKISHFILEQVEEHPSDLTLLVARQFGFSRQNAHKYIVKEVNRGKLIKIGHARHTRYFLVGGKYIEFDLELPGLKEDLVWSKYIRPMVLNYSDNIQRICAYGFTEILNNAIDHSGGSKVFINLGIKDNNLIIIVIDNGVGIFRKIQNALNLDTMKEAILHLSKGKFTTDPANHTGEGIFFASRAFDSFSIYSDDMFYTFKNQDWFLSPERAEPFGRGTYIKMILSLQSKKILKEVMDQFADQEIGFGKTIVAVALSVDPNDPHVSRSQAKRLLMGLEKFKSVVLDFKDVELVGPAFIDEIFRVFKNEHPDIDIQYVNANDDVEIMIKRKQAAQK